MCALSSYLWCAGDMFVWCVCVSELLPEILSMGLKEERMSIVSLILSTLKTRVSAQQFTLFHLKSIYGFGNYIHRCFVLLQVVLNKAISKTQKVRFFTPAVLANIASLYKWNGIVDATTDDNRVSHLLFVLCLLKLLSKFGFQPVSLL